MVTGVTPHLQASCLTKSWRVSTHWFGVGSVELALQLLEQGAAVLTGDVGPRFRMLFACENNSSCQCHMFHDIMDRIPDCPKPRYTVIDHPKPYYDH